MKKKFLLVCGALAVGALALSSCGGSNNPVDPTDPSDPSDPGKQSKPLPAATENLDVYVTYNNKHVYASAGDTFNNPIDGKTYTENVSLLPAWKHYAKVLSEDATFGVGRSVTIRDGIEHIDKSPQDRYATDKTDGFKTTNENNTGENIDLYQNTTEIINKMGAAGDAVNLMDYIDHMPNFKAYLDANPVIKDQIMVDGEIYYTPYMDGSNYYERFYQMDAYGVKKLLDGSATGDTTSATAEGRINFTAGKVTPFINADYNYAADQQVKILYNGAAQNVTIKKTDNIIKQQNTLLATGTATGADLLQQFKAYLTAAYGDIKVSGTTVYDNLSKIFVGESAIYNSDDLIALFRVFKANPGLISNGVIPNANVATIYPFTVRQGSSTDRVENVLGFIGNLYGVQGLGSEKDRLFFTADGYWADAATEQASYDALTRANALYQEGLIQKQFQANVKFGDFAFGRNKNADSTYSLMLNDYTAVPAKYNAKDSNNVGTNASTGYESSQLQPVLAPLTYWATDGFTHGAALSDRTGKTLIRYFEETRSLKSESWCIPSNTDNLAAAIKLMDYLMAKEGQVYSDFCSTEYWETDATNTSDIFKGYKLLTYGVDTTPQFNQAVINWSGTHGNSNWGDWWTFCRGALGTTFGIGYIRTSTIDYQSTNMVARGGADALQKATNAGVNFKSNLTDEIKFGTAVPAAGYPNITDDVSTNYDAITTFWVTDSNKIKMTTAYGWIKAVQDPTFSNSTDCGKYKNSLRNNASYTFQDVLDQQNERIKKYLKENAAYYEAAGDGEGYGKVPAYAK